MRKDGQLGTRVRAVAVLLSLVTATLAWASPASAGKPAPAPPTGRLVFGSVRDSGSVPSSQLYAVNADGTGLAKLTNYAWWAVSPAVSPDGSRIAFTGIKPEAAFKDGTQAYHGHKIFHAHDLYVMNADGSHLVRLTNGLGAPTTPTWSPSGSTIAFSIWGPGCPGPCFARHIALMNPDGSGITDITSGPDFDWHPTWSADGTRIAFERDFLDGSGNGALEVMNRDGSGLTSLLSGACCFFDPAWSPDGTKISFWNTQLAALQTVDVGSGKVTSLARDADLGGGDNWWTSSWSPDGGWLAVGSDEFAFGGANLYLVSADGKTKLPVPNGQLAADPQWLPTASG
jgi:Tol biopolymer transport system component